MIVLYLSRIVADCQELLIDLTFESCLLSPGKCYVIKNVIVYVILIYLQASQEKPGTEIPVNTISRQWLVGKSVDRSTVPKFYSEFCGVLPMYHATLFSAILKGSEGEITVLGKPVCNWVLWILELPDIRSSLIKFCNYEMRVKSDLELYEIKTQARKVLILRDLI